MFRLNALLFLVATCVLPAVAHANADLEAGLSAFETGDFDGALSALDRAETGRLSRDDLVRLLDLRVQVYAAQGQTDALQAAVNALLSVDPDYQLSELALPEARNAVDAGRARVGDAIRLRVSPASTTDGDDAVLELTVEHDIGALVRRTVLGVRPADPADAPFATSTQRRIEYNEEVENVYYAQAFGPGDALIASLGSESRPESIGESSGGGGDEHTEPGASPRDGRSSRRPLRIALSVGAVVLAATAVTLGLVLSDGARPSTNIQGGEWVTP